MNRREAMKLGAFAAVSGPMMVSLEGCTFTKAQLEAYAGDVDSACAEIATALGNAPLAAEITADLSVFDQAVNAWAGGSIANDVISASKILEIALGASSLPATLVDVADICINVLDTIIADLPAPTTTVSAVTANGMMVHPMVRFTARRTYKSRKDAVKAFNEAALAAGLKTIK